MVSEMTDTENRRHTDQSQQNESRTLIIQGGSYGEHQIVALNRTARQRAQFAIGLPWN